MTALLLTAIIASTIGLSALAGYAVGFAAGHSARAGDERDWA